MKMVLLAALIFSLACHAATIKGRVVAVAEGDTVTVLDAEKIAQSDSLRLEPAQWGFEYDSGTLVKNLFNLQN